MFETSYIPKWVGYNNRQWTGTENSDLIQPIRGSPYPKDYPFKKYFLESDAPVFEDLPNFISANGPPDLEVNIKVAIQMGNLYDLSLIEKSKTKPLLVVRLGDGNYNIITFNQNLILSEEELEDYRVPILINGKEMKPIDWEKQDSIDAATLTVGVKFNRDGYIMPEAPEGFFTGEFNRGQIYLLIKKQANTDGSPVNPANYSRILQAEIVTFEQLKKQNALTDRSGYWALKEGGRYMKDKTSYLMMESYTKAQYVEVGAAYLYVSNKGVAYDPADSSPFLQKEYHESLSRKGSYRQTFSFAVGTRTDPGENFNDHFFCRV